MIRNKRNAAKSTSPVQDRIVFGAAESIKAEYDKASITGGHWIAVLVIGSDGEKCQDSCRGDC